MGHPPIITFLIILLEIVN